MLIDTVTVQGNQYSYTYTWFLKSSTSCNIPDTLESDRYLF
jgi:hypothetical protein